jgi:hypothetical protein
MRLAFQLGSIVVTSLLALWGSGCRSDGSNRQVPSEADLRPYDFSGHTALKLARVCAQASRKSGHRGARLHLLCGRILLDWYLSAALREDASLLGKLGKQVGVNVPPSGLLPPERIPQILASIENHFNRAHALGRGGTLSHVAEAGLLLTRLQRSQARKWDHKYLDGIREAALPGAAFELQARVIIAGAGLDGLRALRKLDGPERQEIFIRGLGFSCPAEADPGEGSEVRKPTCPLACPSLRKQVFRLSPARRKALIAARCPLSYMGFSQRQHGVYLSRTSLLVARSVSYQLRNLQRLIAHRRHPLVNSLQGALQQLGRRLASLRVPLPLPDMSPGEPGYIQVPLSASADEPIRAPVFLAVDETHLLAGPMPVLGVRSSQVELFDQLEGYTFPGRPLYVADRPAMTTLLEQLHQVWKRITRGRLPTPVDRVALYASANLSAGRFNDLLDLLYSVGIRQVDLVLRNTHGDLGTIAVTLAGSRRGEGPPLSRSAQAAPSQKLPALQLTLTHRRLVLTARSGPLAKVHIKLPANDLAGLRENLEKRTRRPYRNTGGMQLRFGGEIRFQDIARLLHFVRRNTSGRILYGRLVL